ncbi:MAG: PilZ domain-containing protein [Candidatus Binatia bacterium]|nr:PilZ domain-containing protein [candidate division NC10 bacterium]
MSSYTHVRGYPRLMVWLPVECTLLSQEARKVITGKTNSISPGGLGLLLPETVPLRTSVVVQVMEEKPLPGLVVWRDRPMSTDLITSVPHGFAFDEPVDADRILQWGFIARKRAHPRVRVQFDVEFTGAGKERHGTCLSQSRGGMFITTMDVPPTLGTVTLLSFELHETSHMLLIPAQVVWVEIGPGVITGIGVKFLALNPSEDALIGAVVDRLLGEPSPSPDSSLPPSP